MLGVKKRCFFWIIFLISLISFFTACFVVSFPHTIFIRNLCAHEIITKYYFYIYILNSAIILIWLNFYRLKKSISPAVLFMMPLNIPVVYAGMHSVNNAVCKCF